MSPCQGALISSMRARTGALSHQWRRGAVRADLGCLLVAVLFLIIMASTIVFATIFTPPAHNAFV